MAKQRPSSKRWLLRQQRDPAHSLAKRAGYRSRAAMKLLEIDAQEHLFQRNSNVLDLGAAPGSWSQVAQERCMGVISVDIKPIKPISGVKILCCDITQEDTWHKIAQELNAQTCSGVLSDCSPNTCGIGQLDHLRSIALNESILTYLPLVLQKGGWFLTKILDGEATSDFIHMVKEQFGKHRWIKPPSSRGESRERYLLAKHHASPS